MAANFLIATVPAGAVLTKVDVVTIVSSSSGNVTPTINTFVFDTMMTGVQWVNSGAVAPTITTANANGFAWLTFAHDSAIAQKEIDLENAQSYVNFPVFTAEEHWRGQFTVPQAIDVYWSWGQNESLGVTFTGKASGKFYVEWATFP